MTMAQDSKPGGEIAVRLQGVSKQYGSTTVLHPIDLEVRRASS